VSGKPTRIHPDGSSVPLKSVTTTMIKENL